MHIRNVIFGALKVDFCKIQYNLVTFSVGKMISPVPYLFSSLIYGNIHAVQKIEWYLWSMLNKSILGKKK